MTVMAVLFFSSCCCSCRSIPVNSEKFPEFRPHSCNIVYHDFQPPQPVTELCHLTTRQAYNWVRHRLASHHQVAQRLQFSHDGSSLGISRF
ncbi:hypothetical protein BJ166DRAFT_526805 [Pestalotiopsis sp. NC0098]|nr:hypothetical protein BJ166DRAFT_526805 [Pestalotiopsis sp. NC0098]